MSKDMVKVTELKGTYSSAGTPYGPFKASKDKPYLEVPSSIALATGAPVYDPEGSGIPAPAADADADALRADNEELRGKLEAAQQAKAKAEKDAEGLKERVAELEAANEELRGKLEAAQQAKASAPADPPEPHEVERGEEAEPAGAEEESSAAGDALPEDFPMRDLLVEHGFDTVAKVKAGLQKAEGEEFSPVRQVNGIGEKAEQAILKALTVLHVIEKTGNK